LAGLPHVDHHPPLTIRTDHVCDDQLTTTSVFAQGFQSPGRRHRHHVVVRSRRSWNASDTRAPAADTHTQVLPPVCSDCWSCGCVHHSYHPTTDAHPSPRR